MKLRRFKTGTPARCLASSLDYTKMIPQEGDAKIVPFSFLSDEIGENRALCWLTYTNAETHRIIRENFHRSALFGGQIEGIGPRYCPSIEDKVNRFADKERHQTFIEPEGLDTEEMYIQGMSSSLPEDVQLAFYKTIAGLEKSASRGRPMPSSTIVLTRRICSAIWNIAVSKICFVPDSLTAAPATRRPRRRAYWPVSTRH